MDYNKLIHVKYHFCSNSQDFIRDAKFIIIERIEKNTLKIKINGKTPTLNDFNIQLKTVLKYDGQIWGDT